MKKQDNNWTKRFNTLVKPTKLPEIWQRKDGGHLVRARVKDPTTGRLKEIKRVLPDADLAAALAWLTTERDRIKSGVASVPQPQMRFADFVVWLTQKKIAERQIKSAKGRMTWNSKLEHLCAGTLGESAGCYVHGFGEMFVERIHSTHVEEWKEKMAKLINARDYSPVTVNGWMDALRVVGKAAKKKYSLPVSFAEGLDNFDTSEWSTYTEEEPNSLLPEEVGPFMTRFRELHPAHFAMVYLGLITGLRPSSLRPLRRRGPESDVQWEKNRLLVRRSQTCGDEVMNTTKQKRRYAIDLPQEAMDVLKWHVDTQLSTDEQKESDLLFPAVNGKFRTPCVLNKPMAEVSVEIELGKKFTQRGLRRTFNDLARAAQVNDLVTRSISGHHTQAMQHHYSTVNNDEQRQAIAKVIDITKRLPSAGGALGGAQSTGGGAF